MIKELKWLGMMALLAVIVFKAIFYKESLFMVIKTVLSLLWVFVLPGFAVMQYWAEKIGFLERMVAGVVLSAAAMGVASYYLGLIGVNIRYHGLLLPVAFMVIGGFLISKKYIKKRGVPMEK